ncbi:protein of unknown function [Thauera humireducens]|nr:protein of unknown function [Thauera humireducens]
MYLPSVGIKPVGEGDRLDPGMVLQPIQPRLPEDVRGVCGAGEDCPSEASSAAGGTNTPHVRPEGRRLCSH